MNYRRLVSSALPSSILNAEFRYTRSLDTDVRRTFARIRREGRMPPPPEEPMNVRRSPTTARETPDARNNAPHI
jgi:hypothetical protein